MKLTVGSCIIASRAVDSIPDFTSLGELGILSCCISRSSSTTADSLLRRRQMTTATRSDVSMFKVYGLGRYWQTMITTRSMTEFDLAKAAFFTLLASTEMGFEDLYNEYLKDLKEPHNGDRVFEFLRRFVD